MRLRTAGFTLIEVVISTGMGALLLSSLLLLLYSQLSEQQPLVKSLVTNYGTSNFRVVPSPSALRDAVVTIDQIHTAISGSTGVFVLGGYRETAGSSTTSGAGLPLRAGHLLPSGSGLGAGEIAIASSSIPQTAADFRTFLASRPDVQFETSADPSDFTILTISGYRQVSSITQVRRHTSSVDGVSWTFYEVVFDKNLSETRSDTNRFSYRMCMPAVEDAGWVIPPGALHFWFRSDSTWGRREEGPVRLVFPDPFLLGGSQSSGDTAPFSRFLMFVSPAA